MASSIAKLLAPSKKWFSISTMRALTEFASKNKDTMEAAQSILAKGIGKPKNRISMEDYASFMSFKLNYGFPFNESMSTKDEAKLFLHPPYGLSWKTLHEEYLYLPMPKAHPLKLKEKYDDDADFFQGDIAIKPRDKHFQTKMKELKKVVKHGDVVFLDDHAGYRNSYVRLWNESTATYDALADSAFDDYGYLPPWTSIVDDGFPTYYYTLESKVKDFAADGLIDHNTLVPFTRTPEYVQRLVKELQQMVDKNDTYAIISIDGRDWGIINNHYRKSGSALKYDVQNQNVDSGTPHSRGNITLYLSRVHMIEMFKVGYLEDLPPGPIMKKKDFEALLQDGFINNPVVRAIRQQGVYYTNILYLDDPAVA